MENKKWMVSLLVVVIVSTLAILGTFTFIIPTKTLLKFNYLIPDRYKAKNVLKTNELVHFKDRVTGFEIDYPKDTVVPKLNEEKIKRLVADSQSAMVKFPRAVSLTSKPTDSKVEKEIWESIAISQSLSVYFTYKTESRSFHDELVNIATGYLGKSADYTIRESGKAVKALKKILGKNYQVAQIINDMSQNQTGGRVDYIDKSDGLMKDGYGREYYEFYVYNLLYPNRVYRIVITNPAISYGLSNGLIWQTSFKITDIADEFAYKKKYIDPPVSRFEHIEPVSKSIDSYNNTSSSTDGNYIIRTKTSQDGNVDFKELEIVRNSYTEQPTPLAKNPKNVLGQIKYRADEYLAENSTLRLVAQSDDYYMYGVQKTTSTNIFELVLLNIILRQDDGTDNTNQYYLDTTLFYQGYKTDPRLDNNIFPVCYDEKTETLYVSLTQYGRQTDHEFYALDLSAERESMDPGFIHIDLEGKRVNGAQIRCIKKVL